MAGEKELKGEKVLGEGTGSRNIGTMEGLRNMRERGGNTWMEVHAGRGGGGGGGGKKRSCIGGRGRGEQREEWKLWLRRLNEPPVLATMGETLLHGPVDGTR